MSPRLEIAGQETFGGKAICQLAPDGHAFEIFVTDGFGDSYMLVMTAEELYRWAQRRYEPSAAA
jgi:hypothetical protein